MVSQMRYQFIFIIINKKKNVIYIILSKHNYFFYLIIVGTVYGGSMFHFEMTTNRVSIQGMD